MPPSVSPLHGAEGTGEGLALIPLGEHGPEDMSRSIMTNPGFVQPFSEICSTESVSPAKLLQPVGVHVGYRHIGI